MSVALAKVFCPALDSVAFLWMLLPTFLLSSPCLSPENVWPGSYWCDCQLLSISLWSQIKLFLFGPSWLSVSGQDQISSPTPLVTDWTTYVFFFSYSNYYNGDYVAPICPTLLIYLSSLVPQMLYSLGHADSLEISGRVHLYSRTVTSIVSTLTRIKHCA